MTNQADDMRGNMPAHRRMRMLAVSAMTMIALSLAMSACGGSSDSTVAPPPAISDTALPSQAESVTADGSALATGLENLPPPDTQAPAVPQSEDALPSSGGADIPLWADAAKAKR
ncbi:hypothetical protein AWB76_01376 [Caballeronia temeraria]|uniref:Lipoprotein n=1 Tax=Caballeronia temeraria TaxID=1777137 RepID=A0A157ZW63_9BURK|nr:hypothetical protein [Caballeronia temeraria]SAK49784.1 hypothetical protein AWB76_01376 [Caballeronia temeraria]